MNPLLAEYQRSLNGFHQRIKAEAAILLYHGVTKFTSKGVENYSRKHIDADEFYRQMLYLKNNCTVLSIDDFLELQAANDSLPPRSVIISFDDGFRNNYTTAAPILDELGLPAIFYISSGIVNTDLMFWVDAIEDCLNQTTNPEIRIKLHEQTYYSLNTVREKITALDTIKAYCKCVDAAEKNRVIDDIQTETGISPSVTHSPNYEKISWEELKELHSNSLFTIGGHSTYHQILTSLDKPMLKLEIRSSLDLLRINLEADIIHYSYPEGQPTHYNHTVINLLKENGIVCSPTAIPGLNPLGSDFFELRRIMVGFKDLPFPFWDKSL